jgi:hypothetical protein
MSDDTTSDINMKIHDLQKQVWSLRGQNTALVAALQTLTIFLEDKKLMSRVDYKEWLAGMIGRLGEGLEMSDERIFYEVTAGRELLSELIEPDVDPDEPSPRPRKFSVLPGGKG